MKAITVEPHKPETARLEEIAEPDVRAGSVLVEAIAVGVCGTDVEIVEGKYGWAPPGRTRLVLGHESLGRVLDPGPSGALQKGDLVVGIVRRPDPVPCPSCAVGEWDMCRNGQYTERGIKEIDGYMSERWRIEPEYAMKIDGSLGLLGVLLEPTTVVTKAWEQVVAVGQRAFWEPRTVLVTGAGPIGLLAALVAKQRGLDVHVLDRVESGSKPELVRALGAIYHIWYRRGRGLRTGRDRGMHRCRTGHRGGMGGAVWSAPVSDRSSKMPSRGSPLAGWYASRGSGQAGRRLPRPLLMSLPQRCSRTRSWSAASTPTSGTGTRREKYSRAQTARGSHASSRDARHRRRSCARCSGSRMTSRSSLSLRRPDRGEQIGMSSGEKLEEQ